MTEEKADRITGSGETPDNEGAMGGLGPDGHDRRVSRLCTLIGQELGMRPSELAVLGRAGLLHDVGKLGIPRAILDKPGTLTESEWRVMKTHPELGLTILGGTGRITREMLGVLYHHERMDGTGYPHGLVRTQIPIEARIVAVADTYDVLTYDRPYRKAVSPLEAMLRVLADAGPRLDPAVVAALHRVIGMSWSNQVA